MVSPVTAARDLGTEIPAALRLEPKKFDVDKIARTFLGQGAFKEKSSNRYLFSSSAGRATYDSENGTFSIQNKLIDAVKSDDVPDLKEAEQIARHVLNVSGLSSLAGETILSATSEDVLGGALGINKIVSRKFAFKQVLAGATALSQQGSIDVTVGPAGVVTEIKAALVETDTSLKTLARPTNIKSRVEEIHQTAMKRVAEKSPGSSYRVKNHRIGYDAGNFNRLKRLAPAVVEVSVEAGIGEFQRVFVEKIAL
jgi:hypothetical protein